MGLDINGTKFVLYAKKKGVNLSKLATIGRQGLHLWPKDLLANLRQFGWQCDLAQAEQLIGAREGYAEDFLKFVGVADLHTFDNSSYEGATHIHDMNQPVGGEYKERYSAVLDGGSLEHVFNYPTALRNCMEMVEVGGHFLSITPGNNFSGHGFYQFSPELFFSAFTPQNGYELVDVLAYEDSPCAQWYSVSSPASVKGRVTLVNKNPLYLLVIAKRISNVTPFQTPPQQSDYVVAWDKGAQAGGISNREKWRRRIMPRVPKWIKGPLKQFLWRGYQASFYQKFDPAKDAGK